MPRLKKEVAEFVEAIRTGAEKLPLGAARAYAVGVRQLSGVDALDSLIAGYDEQIRQKQEMLQARLGEVDREKEAIKRELDGLEGYAVNLGGESLQARLAQLEGPAAEPPAQRGGERQDKTVDSLYPTEARRKFLKPEYQDKDPLAAYMRGKGEERIYADEAKAEMMKRGYAAAYANLELAKFKSKDNIGTGSRGYSVVNTVTIAELNSWLEKHSKKKKK